MKRFYGFILLLVMVLSLTTCTNKDKQNNGHLTALADTKKKDRTGKVPIFNAPAEEQKQSFFKRRDEKSFVTLMDSYFYEDVYGEGLAYAIIAANRFNIPKANSYVYLLPFCQVRSATSPPHLRPWSVAERAEVGRV